MMRRYIMRNLKIYNLESGDCLVQPERIEDITLNSCALEVLIDYRNAAPRLIEGKAIAQQTAELMASEHQNMKLVVDEDEHFMGIVSFEDISEQNILLTAIENGINRNEVLVADLMHSRTSLPVMDYDDVKRSTVSEVIHTLRQYGQQYCLVVDRAEHHILGILSSREISRTLKRYSHRIST